MFLGYFSQASSARGCSNWSIRCCLSRWGMERLNLRRAQVDSIYGDVAVCNVFLRSPLLR